MCGIARWMGRWARMASSSHNSTIPCGGGDTGCTASAGLHLTVLQDALRPAGTMVLYGAMCTAAAVPCRAVPYLYVYDVLVVPDLVHHRLELEHVVVGVRGPRAVTGSAAPR